MTKVAKSVLARNIRHHRDIRSLSQEQLARKAGVSLRLLQQIESERGNPTVGTCAQLGVSLGLEYSSLFLLRDLRLGVPDLEFVSRFTRLFQDAPYGATLRNFGSSVVCGNPWIAGVHKRKEIEHSVSFLDLYVDEARPYLQKTLECEQRGNVLPFSMLFRQKVQRRARPLRVNPTRILTRDGKAAVYLANYIFEIEKEPELGYVDFCGRLMACATAGPAPRKKKAGRAR